MVIKGAGGLKLPRVAVGLRRGRLGSCRAASKIPAWLWNNIWSRLLAICSLALPRASIQRPSDIAGGLCDTIHVSCPISDSRLMTTNSKSCNTSFPPT